MKQKTDTRGNGNYLTSNITAKQSFTDEIIHVRQNETVVARFQFKNNKMGILNTDEIH